MANQAATTLTESIRRPTTFLLAVFLWLHALLFLNPHSAVLSKCAQLLRLTTSEVVFFVLLVTFSIVTGSGFWRTFRSLAYIYFSPFVLFGYACYGCFCALRGINRWFISQANPGMEEINVVVQPKAAAVTSDVVASPKPGGQTGTTNKSLEILRVLFRPFRTSTLLWCFLLLIATHAWVVSLSLAVVLLHLGRKIFWLAKVTLFSGPFLRKVGLQLLMTVDTALAGLAMVTKESDVTAELRNLFNQLLLIEKATKFLSNRELVVRWAWLIAAVLLGFVYVYVAFLFSFVYYGVAEVSGFAFSWPDAFVTSLFIPFLIGDLPKIIWAKLLGGIQCTLIVGFGAGAVFNYIHRRLESIRTEAMTLSERFADQATRERIRLLREKVGTAATHTPRLPPKSGGD
jgi:hypothetical protein